MFICLIVQMHMHRCVINMCALGRLRTCVCFQYPNSFQQLLKRDVFSNSVLPLLDGICKNKGPGSTNGGGLYFRVEGGKDDRRDEVSF